jgi:hypothetical protein
VTRVEWTRQTGDDVEAVVGMLICSQFPNAVRVTPSHHRAHVRGCTVLEFEHLSSGSTKRVLNRHVYLPLCIVRSQPTSNHMVRSRPSASPSVDCQAFPGRGID